MTLRLKEYQNACSGCEREFYRGETVFEDDHGRRFCVVSGCAKGRVIKVRAIKIP